MCGCGHRQGEGLSDVALGKALLSLTLLALLQTSMAEILIVNLVSSLLQILEVCPEGERRGEGRGEERRRVEGGRGEGRGGRKEERRGKREEE